MGPVRRLEAPAEVVIIRSGYATQALYLEALAQAHLAGRNVRAILPPETEETPDGEW